MNRIVALIDMDCFYVQVEQRLDPTLRNQPCAVVQYKTWKGGGIIAVNYEARDCGVTRNMMGDDAKKKCPSIKLARVPEVRGKADLTRYRDASKDVFDVLTQFSDCVEKASIDEAYIDLTETVQKRVKASEFTVTPEQLGSTCVVGWGAKDCDTKAEKEYARKQGVEDWLDRISSEDMPDMQEQQLAVAAVIMEEIRAAVYKQTTFRCSAGIAHNKMLAKLACGIHKPNRQTVLPRSSVPGLYADLPLKKVRNLGGKLGDSLMEELGCNTMADLSNLSLRELQKQFGEKVGAWLFDLGRGVDNEPVTPRQLVKSIGCSKNFRGKTALATKSAVKHWLLQMAEEVAERLKQDQESNKRIAKGLTVSIHQLGSTSGINVTRSIPITTYDAKKFSHDAFAVIQKLNTASPNKEAWQPAVVSLGLSASRFQDQLKEGSASIETYFGQGKQKLSSTVTTCSNGNAGDNGLGSDVSVLPSSESTLNQRTLLSNSTRVTCSESAPGSYYTLFTKRLEITCASENVMQELPKQSEGEIQDEVSVKNVNVKETNTAKKGFFARKIEELASQAGASKSSTMKDCTSNDANNSAVSAGEDTCDSFAVLCDNVLADLPPHLQDEIKIERMRAQAEKVGKEAIQLADAKSGLNKFFNSPLKDRKLHPVSCQETGENNCSVSNLSNGDECDSPASEVDDCTEDTAETSPLDDMVFCEDCGKSLLVWDLPEHQDYHVALKLQKELRSSDSVPVTSKPQPQQRQRPPKRGRRSKKHTSPVSGKKLRSIDSFFASDKT